MKAILLTAPRKLEVREVPTPTIQSPNDVLIRITRVGVCGSDVHYFTHGRIGSQVVQYPYRVGHEGAGIVEAVGSNVTNVKPGDHIAVEPAMSCWECDQCKAGRHHTCRKLKFLGCPGQAEGCLSEFLVMPKECCFPLHGLTDEQGSLSEPLAIGVYAVKRSIPMAGAKIGILGSGPIGLSVLMPAIYQGASAVYVSDKIDARLSLAASLGATWTGNPSKIDLVSTVNGLEPQQLDVVFECCGEQDALDTAVDILKPGGLLMVVGIPSVDRISFSIDQLRRKELTVRNVRRQVDCVEAALDLIAKGHADVDLLVTHHFKPEQAQEAFELVEAYRDGVVKAMIEF